MTVNRGAQCNWFTQYRTSDVAENIGRQASCTKRTTQENDFESILTVKMENPVVGSFGSEFPAIYNHCVFMADRSRKTLKF